MPWTGGPKIWQVTVRDVVGAERVVEIGAWSFRVTDSGHLWLSRRVEVDRPEYDTAVFAPGVWLGIRVKED